MSASSVHTNVSQADLGPPLVFSPEPGACGGRLNPGQTVIPSDLSELVDFHVWPSASPLEISPMARTVCEHIDYAAIAAEHPDLFTQRRQYGAPELPELWEARERLGALGYTLCLDVQFEAIEGNLALVVFGAGVVGRLTDRAWAQVADLLTSSGSAIVEPAPDTVGSLVPLRPARPSSSRGKRDLPVPSTPLAWQVGDWVHTWWSYPLMDPPFRAGKVPEFGPGMRSLA